MGGAQSKELELRQLRVRVTELERQLEEKRTMLEAWQTIAKGIVKLVNANV